jgi:hypothetical protein
MTTNNALYKQYTLYRKYAWQRHDQLAAQGTTLDALDADEQYQHLCKRQHAAFERWQNARKVQKS